ncbi:putative a-alpha x4 protein [Neofusicoccum parvum UCRNP2]|uniref:Putative a-alpha x4 protein n=1 Tax=Botryosphaeria parva (strain UCR-NP2) TaxID=1287680 RepID=R1GB89_BOTPV|nr:putative a-alpha x4 protein [Neofusicoccum parvum UCRNP2]
MLYRRRNMPSGSFEKWRAAEQGQRVESRIGYSFGDGRDWGDDRSLPTFHECGVPSVVYYGDGAKEAVDKIYDHMRRCDDVRELSMAMEQGGCVIGSGIRRSFDWQPGDTFSSALESLTLSGYDWDEQTQSGLSAAQAWAPAMDWARLKRLDISRPSESFLDAFQARLPGLESLTIRPTKHFWGDELTFCEFDAEGAATRQRYVDFIAAMPPLRELSIAGMGELLDLGPILAAHGQTLRSLGIHEFEEHCFVEGSNSTQPRPLLSTADMQKINGSAPHLESLTLDLYRNGALPYKELELLSTFPALRELTLNLDLEDPSRSYISKHCATTKRHAAEYCNQNYLMEPTLNVSTASDILTAVRGWGRPDGEGVAKLVLIAGDYKRGVSGGLLVYFLTEPNEPSRFECEWDITGNGRCIGSAWDRRRPVEKHMLNDVELESDDLYGD